jgi:hypothetical protein
VFGRVVGVDVLSARHAKRSALSELEVADAVRGTSLAGVRAIEGGERLSLNYE